MVVISKIKKDLSKKILTKYGFTLVEMVVCLAIMAVITSVFLGSRSGYTDQLNLRNEAYLLALSFREAQVESLGVKSEGGNFNVSYGLHFQDTWIDRFVYFTDVNLNGTYESSGVDQGKTITLGNNISIQSVCHNNGLNCWGGNFRQLAISWKRPESVPSFIYTNNGGNNPTVATTPIVITLLSPNNKTITVRVGASGAVSIQ